MGEDSSYYNTTRIRRSLRHFISGRMVGALGAFAATILVVRHLSVADYGVFTTAVGSSIVVGLVFGLGIEKLIPRYLPELRSRGDLREMALLGWVFLLLRMFLLLPAFVLLYLCWDLIADAMRIDPDASVYWGLIAYIGAFLLGKQASDTLQAILCHREAALGLVADALVRVAILGGFAWYGGLTLNVALWAYVGGALTGALVCLGGMRLRFAAPGIVPKSGMKIESASLVQYGWHSYLHNLGGIPMTPQALRIFCATLLGAAGVAALGFAQSLTEFARRYLPVNFLIGMIEPIFISRYRETRDFKSLELLVSVMLKLNLFILAPMVSWLAFSGRGALDLMTGGKYLDQMWLLIGLLVLLALESHRTLIHLVIMAVDETWLMVMSQFWPLAMLVALGALVIGYGLTGLLGGLAGIALFVNVYLVRRLRDKGYPYRPDWKNIARMALYATAAGMVGEFVGGHIGGWAGSLVAAATVATVFLGIGTFWRTFSPDEKNVIDRLIGKPLWAW